MPSSWRARIAACSLFIGAVNAFSLQGSASIVSAVRDARIGYRGSDSLHTQRSSSLVLVEGPSPPLLTDKIWGMWPPVRVEGNSLRTWELSPETTERVQLSLRSNGRPIYADVELWTKPSYIPTRLKVWCEDGRANPFHTILETPWNPKTVAVFNTGCVSAIRPLGSRLQ